MNWHRSYHARTPADATAETERGTYTVVHRKRRYILRWNGRVIGIHSDPVAIVRLADADYSRRNLSDETSSYTE